MLRYRLGEEGNRPATVPRGYPYAVKVRKGANPIMSLHQRRIIEKIGVLNDDSEVPILPIILEPGEFIIYSLKVKRNPKVAMVWPLGVLLLTDKRMIFVPDSRKTQNFGNQDIWSIKVDQIRRINAKEKPSDVMSTAKTVGAIAVAGPLGMATKFSSQYTFGISVVDNFGDTEFFLPAKGTSTRISSVESIVDELRTQVSRIRKRKRREGISAPPKENSAEGTGPEGSATPAAQPTQSEATAVEEQFENVLLPRSLLEAVLAEIADEESMNAWIIDAIESKLEEGEGQNEEE